MQIPNVTLRHVTERPETVECGSSILRWDPGMILQAVDAVLNLDCTTVPTEYIITQQVQRSSNYYGIFPNRSRGDIYEPIAIYRFKQTARINLA